MNSVLLTAVSVPGIVIVVVDRAVPEADRTARADFRPHLYLVLPIDGQVRLVRLVCLQTDTLRLLLRQQTDK